MLADFLWLVVTSSSLLKGVRYYLVNGFGHKLWVIILLVSCPNHRIQEWKTQVSIYDTSAYGAIRIFILKALRRCVLNVGWIECLWVVINDHHLAEVLMFFDLVELKWWVWLLKFILDIFLNLTKLLSLSLHDNPESANKNPLKRQDYYIRCFFLR